MAEEYYQIPDDPQYSIDKIRKLQNSDPASAEETFNPLISRILENIAALQVKGAAYQFGHGLKQEGVNVSVDMSSDDNPDKSLPISAASVEAAVGNIEVLLKTI